MGRIDARLKQISDLPRHPVRGGAFRLRRVGFPWFFASLGECEQPGRAAAEDQERPGRSSSIERITWFSTPSPRARRPRPGPSRRRGSPRRPVHSVPPLQTRRRGPPRPIPRAAPPARWRHPPGPDPGRSVVDAGGPARWRAGCGPSRRGSPGVPRPARASGPPGSRARPPLDSGWAVVPPPGGGPATGRPAGRDLHPSTTVRPPDARGTADGPRHSARNRRSGKPPRGATGRSSP